VGVGGEIVHTADGITWQAQESGTDQALLAVSFPDSQTGFALGTGPTGGIAFRTTDGGQTWNPLASIPSNVQCCRDVYFLTPQTGWMVGNELIYRSDDGGATWNAQANPSVDCCFKSFFLDDRYGWAVGASGSVVATNDGQTWFDRSVASSSFIIAVHFADTETGTIVGSGGVVYRTTDGGVNWQADLDPSEIDFSTVTTVFMFTPGNALAMGSEIPVATGGSEALLIVRTAAQAGRSAEWQGFLEYDAESETWSPLAHGRDTTQFMFAEPLHYEQLRKLRQ
jgi:photosystem II stability/assembly factor-like uncharacterized protein